MNDLIFTSDESTRVVMSPETLQFDETRLTAVSARFSARLLQRLPQLRSYAAMEAAGQGQCDLVIEAPSPSGDSQRQILIWMEDGTDPSVGFGDWHTHIRLDRDPEAAMNSIIDQIAAILLDHLVLAYDVGGTYDGHCDLIDLTDETALAEHMTQRFSPDSVQLKSWSGSRDRLVHLNDVKLD